MPRSDWIDQYSRDRRFIRALARFLDELPRPATTIVGEGHPDGSVTYREVPTPELRLTEALDVLPDPREAKAVHRDAARIGLQDLLELSRELSQEEVTRADALLETEGCETLTAARHRVWRTVPKILKRGRIRNEEEYYLMVERLNDVTDSTLSGDDRSRLSEMVERFEQDQVS